MDNLASLVKTIWIVDDDADDILIFEKVLGEIFPAITLTTLFNADELLAALITQHTPDLLFLDINLPCKNGKECLDEIRSQEMFSNLPIVIYSGSSNPIDITTSYAQGANLYVHKPSRYKDLCLLIRNVLTLDWTNGKYITTQQLVDGRYVAFGMT